MSAPPAVTIRSARADDAPDLTALAKRSKAHWGYPPEWLAAWDGDLTLSGSDIARHHAWVAERDGRIVGTCLLARHAAGSSLEHVWIDPDAIGTGVGRQLVTRALEAAAEMSALPVDVLSDPHAEAFYLRLGAVRVGAEPASMPGAPDRVLPLLRFTAGLGR